MWVASKPFRYRGVRYNAGDQVPAESWPGRRALVSMRKIRREEEPVPDPRETPFKSMKRADLNEFAIQQGIEDAETYPNRESLIEKLEEILSPQSEDEDETESEGEIEDEDEEADEPEEIKSEDTEDEIDFTESDEDTEESPQD